MHDQKKRDKVEKLQEYLIPFSVLKEGLHTFSFEAGDMFFARFSNTDVTGGDIKVLVNLQKNNTYLELEFLISGFLRITCDRCLDEFNSKIEANEKIYVRFGEEYCELEDNVIVIPFGDKKIDISQFIYEYSILSLPLRRIHPEDNDGKPACVGNMLEILEKHSEKKNKLPDPIWDSLKNIIN